jgi:hypothetical protein
MLRNMKDVGRDLTYNFCPLCHDLVDEKHHVESYFDQQSDCYVMAQEESHRSLGVHASHCHWRDCYFCAHVSHSGLRDKGLLHRQCMWLFS